MKRVKKLVCLLTAVALSLGALVVNTTTVFGSEKTPLVVCTSVKRTQHEYIKVDLDQALQVQGNNLAITLYVKNVSLPTAQVSLSITDSNGTEYKSNTYNAKKLNAVKFGNEQNSAVKVNLLKNSEFFDVNYGFYGTVYIPYTELNRAANLTPSDVKSVKVGFGAQSLGYDSLEVDIQKVYVFNVADVTLNSNGEQTAENKLVDFLELQTQDITVIGDTLELTKADEYDMDSLEYNVAHQGDLCERIGDVKVVHNFDLKSGLTALNSDGALHDRLWTYSKMGQTCTYSFEQSLAGNYGDMLKYTLGVQQDPNVSNVYSSLHFNLDGDSQDWSGAKGITCWIKNPAPTEYSMGFEIFLYNPKTDLVEQYNLNSVKSLYKTVYAYNVVTGEEFSYNTQTFIRIPANFEGWIRVPFSQYDAPNWSTLEPYNNQGVFDTNNYRVVKMSFSRLLKSNFGSTLYFDNLGVYYNDFAVGGLFEQDKPSIKDCLNGGN